MKQQTPDNLTICANAALAAGMSYGKYMALRQSGGLKPPTEEAGMPSGTRVCIVCGKKYIPTVSRQKYCSYQCRYNAEYQAQRKRLGLSREEIPKKICVICGKVYTPTMRGARLKYCSPQCRDVGRHRTRSAKRGEMK